jgi:hypothetical protein
MRALRHLNLYAQSYWVPIGLFAIIGHELPQSRFHFWPNFTPHPDVQYKPRVTRRQAPEFRGWQLLIL